MNKSRYRLLHVFLDEKIVDTFISMMEVLFPEESIYLILTHNEKLKNVKTVKNVKILNPDSKKFHDFISNHIFSFQEIIFHGLLGLSVYNQFYHPNMSWVIWGGDLYETLLYHKGYRIYINDSEYWTVRSGRFPTSLYRFLCNCRGKINMYKKLDLINRIKRVYAMELDYNLLVHYFPKFNLLSHSYLTYYPIDEMLNDDIVNKYVSGKNIWVNHSACASGNHVEIYNIIKNTCTKRIVYSPLSYGDSKFKSYFINKGKHILQDQFYPIVDFLSRSEYYRLFLDASAFVFGHLRQCAEGNIIIALYLGGKCFFYKQNPLYEYYKSLGCTVYSIDDDLNKQSLEEPLPLSIRESNRRLILDNFSYQRVMEILRINFAPSFS